MNIVMLTPVATPRQGVIAKEHGKTEKGYIYEKGDVITGKYVIDKRSYEIVQESPWLQPWDELDTKKKLHS